MSDEPVMVRMSDIRACDMCSRGTRAFFIRHDLDFNAFLSDGIEASALEATGDAMALRVVEQARKRHGRR